MEFGWNSVDLVLLPNKCIITLPEIYTVTCGCKAKCTASLALHVQKFASALEKNVITKFTNRLSWTLHKIYKNKSFLWTTFFNIWTESKDIYAKICTGENPYISSVWHILLISPGNYTSLNKNYRHYTENK